MARLKFWGTHGGYPTDQQMTCLQFTTAEANLLIDLGSVEIFKHMQMLCEIDAVLLTHLHSDHSMFLSQFFLARLRTQGAAFRRDSCPIYAPESPAHIMESGAFPGDWIPWSHLAPEHIKDVRISTIFTVHSRPCWAYKLQTDGKTVVISGDTSYFAELAEFARGADWLICECNDSDEREEHARTYGHMTPAGVAQVIHLARPRHTVLYHLDMLSPRECAQAVSEHLDIDSDVRAAEDGLVLEL